MKVGDEVNVYDRYRFAIPLRARVADFSDQNDGVRLELLQSNNADYPTGCSVWVHAQQCVPNGADVPPARPDPWDGVGEPATPGAPPSVLLIADRLIHGDRAREHGSARDTYGRAAKIFNGMTGHCFTAETVVLSLIAIKLARHLANPKNRDNLIDAAGYIGLLDEMQEGK